MPRLTKKQAEEMIEAYLAQHPNATSSEIGKALGVSERIIKNQVTVILAKLNASNRAHAVALAMQQGLISPDEAEPAKTVSK